MYVCDPDIITGYNIINFDFPYILTRAKHLNIQNYGRLGRYLCNLSQIKGNLYTFNKNSKIF